MSITRKIATGAAAAALGASLSLASFGLAASVANASPAYGGSSHASFGHGTYHQGGRVHFKTGHNFKKHTHVTEYLHGPHGYSHKVGSGKANGSGQVTDGFKLGKHVPPGNYRLVVRGGGAKSTGHFHVKKHH